MLPPSLFMRRFNVFVLLLPFATMLTADHSLAGSDFRFNVENNDFEVGKSVVNITPPVPYRMSGYFSERLSTGIKDRLFAKTLVFKQGTTRGAIVFCDLIGISVDVAQRARKLAEEKTGIPARNISITATHSHTGPLYFGALRKHFHDRMVAATGKDQHESFDYPKLLVDKIVSSISEANSAAQPVQIQTGFGTEKRLSFNRRFHMKNGGVRFNPGQQNPNILRVAGPIDPEIGVVTFSEQGKSTPWGALVAFALHLDTVGGTEYSADYPGHMQNYLREKINKDFTSFFGAGTCGDINHIDVKIKGRRSAKEIGSMLGQSVEKKINSLAKPQEPSLAIRNTRLEAELQSFTDEEIGKARSHMKMVDSPKLSFLERVHAYKVTAVGQRPEKTIPLEIHAFRLSTECAIVTLPGEVFVELGLAIKTASPFETTIVIELANDAPGYLPTRKAFAEGSYETVNSRIKSGYGEKMATAAIRLLKELAAE